MKNSILSGLTESDLKYWLSDFYSKEDLDTVVNYLKNRKSKFNPWFDFNGSWFNQTGIDGKPIEGEAKERLLYNATHPNERIKSNYRFRPIDKVRFILENELTEEMLADVAAESLFRYSYQHSRFKLNEDETSTVHDLWSNFERFLDKRGLNWES